MDDRQRTIVEGAGLEESRLNQDFIDFLRKWGTPILLLVVVAAVLYSGSTMWARYQERSHDQAYADFHAAAVAGSPDNLVVVAEQHKGRGAVYELALIEAADAYLESARSGIRPGGDASNPDDKLTEEQIAGNLNRAGELYSRIVSGARSKRGHELHLLNGLFGQAAVFESLGNVEQARETLTRATEVARASGFAELGAVADERLGSLASLADLPRVYDASEVRSSATPQNNTAAPLNSTLGGSLTPNAPSQNPFILAPQSEDNPLPTPPPGIAPTSPQDEGAPTP
jgi:tetratricopeptide (TPR) repeat protein